MQKQTYTNDSGFWKKTSDTIKDKSWPLMEWMKANTATQGIVDGSGEQMIQIHQHGEHHNCINFEPLVFVSKSR